MRLPARRETSGTDDRAAHGHVRIHVANVVHKRTAGQARDQSAGDAFDGRIGHGQHDVRRNGERPRNRQRKIGQIIRDAAAHLKARKGGRAHALDGQIAAHFAPQEITRMALGRIVARPARQHGHAVIHRERLRDLRGALGRGAGVRRKIFVQKKNMHRLIREEQHETSASMQVPHIMHGIVSSPDQRGASADARACGPECRQAPAHPFSCAENIRWLPRGGKRSVRCR